MVGAVTAAVAAVGSLGLAAYSMSQQQSMANDQKSMANNQFGLEKDLYNQQGKYRTQLDQLMADPGSVAKLPGYAFARDEGATTVARQGAANPGGGGAAALTRYGEDYASSAYQQQAQLLASLSGLNQNPASYGQVGTQGAANASDSQGRSFAQLQQLLAQGGATAKMFGPQGSYSSAGTPGSGNVPWAGTGTDPTAGVFRGGMGPPQW